MKKILVTLLSLCVAAPVMSQVAAAGISGGVPAQTEVAVRAGTWRLTYDFGISFSDLVSAPGFGAYFGDPSPDRRTFDAGFAYGFDAHYFRTGAFGVGGRITGRHYSVSDGSRKDKVNTVYAAPSASWCLYNEKRSGAFVAGFGLGYMLYMEKYDVTDPDFGYARSELITKGAFAPSINVGYDVKVSGKMFAGLKITAMIGSLDLDHDDDNWKQDVTAIDITAGLRF